MITRVALLAGAFGTLGLLGCIGNLVGGTPEPTLEGAHSRIAVSKLERYLDNFADRDVTLVSDACDLIKREVTTPEARRLLDQLKVQNATAVYDIVTSPNTLGHLLDLYVMVQLQHLVWITEGQARKLFGDRGHEHAALALGAARQEISNLADLAMKTDRREKVDQKILDWRRNNPEVQFVSMIRFGSLPEASGKSILEAIPSFFDILNPLDDAARSVEDTKKMAERVFFLSKRMPQLLNWQTESLLDGLLSKHEVSQVIEGVQSVSGSVDRVSRTLERVPEQVATERKEILAAWDAREKDVRSTVTETRELASRVTEALKSGKDLAVELEAVARSVGETLKIVERLKESDRGAPAGPPGKPFDLTEVTLAAAEMSKTVRELNGLVHETQSLLESPGWTRREADVNRVTTDTLDRASRHGRDWVDHVTWRVVQLL
ncbi:MAG TPA: hypothetical protein VEN81_17360, partial [Planctomycetota bacterium]|nr:hypothetical protein [Planctomycetota bacterium]